MTTKGTSFTPGQGVMLRFCTTYSVGSVPRRLFSTLEVIQYIVLHSVSTSQCLYSDAGRFAKEPVTHNRLSSDNDYYIDELYLCIKSISSPFLFFNICRKLYE